MSKRPHLLQRSWARRRCGGSSWTTWASLAKPSAGSQRLVRADCQGLWVRRFPGKVQCSAHPKFSLITVITLRPRHVTLPKTAKTVVRRETIAVLTYERPPKLCFLEPVLQWSRVVNHGKRYGPHLQRQHLFAHLDTCIPQSHSM